MPSRFVEIKKKETVCFHVKKNIAVCRITEGYRHQVRAHLAYSGYPICGDKLYNPNAKPDEKMQFEAFRFEFTDPKSLKNIFYEL